jgi:hypothetical protein
MKLLSPPRTPVAAKLLPNIVPENNLRLPDALTVKHGPAPLLSRFVLEGDKRVRGAGIRLHLRHDFDELVYINKHETQSGTWFPLINMFNPRHTDLTPEDSYWLCGERDNGDIVMTWAARVYHWPETSFKEEASALFCTRDGQRQPCIVTAPDAADIRGVVFWGGSFWIHPDFRHLGLSPLLGRLGRCFAVSRWPVDWIMCLIAPALVKKGVADGYGYRHQSPGVFFPQSPLGDLELVLAYLSAEEAYEDFSAFFDRELSSSGAAGEGTVSPSNRLLHTVTRTSSVPVFHGNRNRS